MNFYPLRRWFVLDAGALCWLPRSDRCCACDLIVDRYVLRCVQILFFGDHHVENTVFDTQFLKACFAMGLLGGDLVPGDFEVVMDPGDPADTERVIQHQLQRGNGVTLPPEGGIDHDAHIPPILFGCIMKIYITDPCSVGAAFDISIETLRLLSYPFVVPIGKSLVRMVHSLFFVLACLACRHWARGRCGLSVCQPRQKDRAVSMLPMR